MVVALIIACEVGFWVLLVAGLALRYLARMPRTGAAVLLTEPLLELVLLVVTAIDLKNGAAADWKHGLAALYIGFTVAYGHYMIKWADGHFLHRFAGGPPPVRPPKYGLPRARHELRLWLRTLLGMAVAAALLQAAIWYVGEDGDAASLRATQGAAARILLVHGVITATYFIWRKKEPARPAATGQADLPPRKTLR
ncbi:hypothetical protein SSP35_01_08330 [Streptomyces sp. NBRC 110611]|uniref:hypothetical protein n=1 Tax=Streptomyces sp. NBRC 110611 TaxID=1621259 RepID=UPI000834A4E4|nr:hypothetical protein [Streptomyces sp. NBRC 110611]GAU65491.1 hypothetical protein SSP35_01_08330 [Streptomyces sp. NBRC 110611]